jgi:DAK2 domain fusion protein YloV
VLTLSATDLRQAVVRYRDALRLHQEELNRLNVYPVPDGDTGTNMALTLESVLEHLNGAETMPEVCQAMARGSLMGARGNSGVILSQVLRGLADTFRDRDELDATTIAGALRRASDGAYQAVMRPVEGTILTVVRSAAEAAESLVAAAQPTLANLLEHVATAAAEALERTPELLPALSQAGVVDAGGRGFVLLIDALLNVVTGRPLPEPVEVAAPVFAGGPPPDGDVSSLRYEVMFFLEGDDELVPAFRERWAEIGDSIVVVGGDGTWNCHVHTDDVGAAIEAALDAGRPRAIRVTDLAEQVEEERWVRDQIGGEPPAAEPEPQAPVEPVTTAVVVVGVGDGIRRLLLSLGAHAVVAGGQTMNPSTRHLLEAAEAAPADSVVILPNNKNIVPVAHQVAALTKKKVEVVPTTTVTEGLAALVAYDPDASIQPNVGAMNEAAARVRSGEVTRAVRDSHCDLGPIAHGDWLALARGDGIVAVKRSAGEAVVSLVDQLIDDESELVTVLVGADAHPADTARLLEHLATNHPGVDAEVHEGGQPLYPWLVGVE